MIFAVALQNLLLPSFLNSRASSHFVQVRRSRARSILPFSAIPLDPPSNPGRGNYLFWGAPPDPRQGSVPALSCPHNGDYKGVFPFDWATGVPFLSPGRGLRGWSHRLHKREVSAIPFEFLRDTLRLPAGKFPCTLFLAIPEPGVGLLGYCP